MILRSLVLAACLAGTATFASAADDAVAVTDAWTRATPGGVAIGAAYLTLRATTADKLTAVATPSAGRAEIHTHIHENGVMKMRRLESLELKAGETRTLAPGGDHLMLFDLKEPLKDGATVPLTLSFEKAGTITIEAKVYPVGSPGPGKN